MLPDLPRSTVSLPAWAMGLAVFVAGGLVGAVVVLVATRSPATGIAAVRSSTGAAATSSPTVTLAMSSEVTTPSPSRTDQPTTPPPTTPAPRPTPTRPPRPNGSVRLLSAELGNGYGQESATGSCSQWTLRLENDSDTEVRQLTFASKSAGFTDFSQYDAKTNTYPTVHAATPAPVVLNLSVPAHSSQDVHFRTCTSTPTPGDSYDFDVIPADEHGFVWVTGYHGRVCFGFSC